MDNHKRRTCNQVGHQNQNPTHICTFSDCELDNRWVCGECFKNETHKHNQLDQRHILNKEDFIKHISEQAQPLIQLQKNQKQMLKECLDVIRNYSDKLKEYFGYFQLELSRSIINKEILNFNTILKTANQEFELLDNQNINTLLNINSQNFKVDFRNSLQKFKEVIENIQQLFDLMKQMIGLNIQIQEKVKLNQKVELNPESQVPENTQKAIEILNENWLDQLNLNPHMQFDYDGYISTSQISQNKQFLVIGGLEKRLQVYNLETRQEVYSVVLDNIVKISKFTQDSKYVVIGDEQGYLYQYQLQNEFKEIYKQRIHQSQISDLILIDSDSTLTCSYDKSIIMMNIAQNKQLLNIQNVHSDQIRGIDYDQHKSLIVSCSDDKSIKVMDSKNGQILFQQENAHTLFIQQVQFIINDQLISSNINDLFLWQIDHNQRQLTIIKQIEQKNYNVSSIFNNQRICAVCEKTIKIYDNQLNTMQEINHNIKEFLYYSRLRQLNSLKYIIIPGKNNLQVMVKQ